LIFVVVNILETQVPPAFQPDKGLVEKKVEPEKSEKDKNYYTNFKLSGGGRLKLDKRRVEFAMNEETYIDKSQMEE
jgi:hypothetical protein